MSRQREGNIRPSQVEAIMGLIGTVKPTDNSFIRWLEKKHQIPAGTVRSFMKSKGLHFVNVKRGGVTISRVSVLV